MSDGSRSAVAFLRFTVRVAFLALCSAAAPLAAQDTCYNTCQNWICDTGQHWVDDYCQTCNRVCDTGWNWIEESCTACNTVCDTCSDCQTNCDEEGNCWEECSSYSCNCHDECYSYGCGGHWESYEYNCRDECSSNVCGGHWESTQTNCRWEAEACNPHPCPPPPEWCGDGSCNNGENCGSCEQDCGPCAYCGNGTCDPGTGEDCGTCLQDCPCWNPNFPVCENRQCVAAPPPPPSCGNGTCDLGTGEDCGTCLQDCPCWNPNFPVCENRQCVAGPPPQPTCGNGTCDAGTGEDCGTCLQDCPCWNPSFPVCQNRQCVAATAACGNDRPDPGEDCQSCPADVGLRPGFTVSPSTVRLGQGITLTADSSQILDPPVPLWDLGNGEHLDGASLTYTYPATGTFGVVLTSTEAACGTPRLSAPTTVVVLPPLTCDFSDLPPSLQVCCPNTTCDPGENAGTCPQDCPTFCGDRYCVPSRGETPASCPADCCASQSNCPAGCAALPGFTVSNLTPVIAEPVTFTAFGGSIVPDSRVNWDFGDTNHCVQCGLSEAHTYTTPGEMEVRLTSTESVCGTSQVSRQWIRVYDRAIFRGDSASVTGHTLPSTLACGATQEVTVTLLNNGNTTWTAAAGYALGAVGDEDPFAATTRIPLPRSVGPLQSVTFTFTLSGGTRNGTFTTDWQMVHDGVAWFGAVAQSQVTVPAAAGCGLDASGDPLSLTLDCNEGTEVHLRMHNTGTAAWTPEEDFALTLVEGDALSDTIRIPVTATVLPDGEHIFSFDVTAPGVPGTTTAFWQMTRGDELFGEPVSQQVTVESVCDDPGDGFLDNGTSVDIDNMSSMTTAKVQELVVKADRSTRTACVNSPKKGLLQSGDRVVVTDNYIAWFDYTKNDGVPFPGAPPGNPSAGPFEAPWERSGALAGWWSLTNQDFRFKKPGTASCPGAVWPINQLIPGSASPNGEYNFWDKYAPPTEVCVAAVPPGGCEHPCLSHFYCMHYAAGSVFWSPDTPIRDAEGIHYVVRGRLTRPEDGCTRLDGCVPNGTDDFIESTLEYVLRPNDARVIWRLKPTVTVTLNNIFYYIWATYAQKMDGTCCDCAPGRPKCLTDPQWPATVPDLMLTTDSFSRSIEQFNLAPACSKEPTCRPTDGHNDDKDSPNPNHGDWIRLGQSPTLAGDMPRWRLQVVGQRNSGDGSPGNPFRINWGRLFAANENTADGTMGLSAGTGPGVETVLLGGKWYVAEFILGTDSP